MEMKSLMNCNGNVWNNREKKSQKVRGIVGIKMINSMMRKKKSKK